MTCFVYILRNPDGKIHIGQTAEIAFCLKQHNDPDNNSLERPNRFELSLNSQG
jgi:predicted GIY-YIG superfamily endonuclease